MKHIEIKDVIVILFMACVVGSIGGLLIGVIVGLGRLIQ